MNPSKSAPLAFEDIKREIRRLVDERWSPGDRVPTAAELARDLGVGLTNTYRAVKALADDGVLVTRVGRGTFVAEPSRRNSVTTGDTAMAMGLRVNVLSLSRHCEGAGLLMGQLVRAFEDPVDVDWQINVLAPMNGQVVMRELLDAAETSPRKCGFVLISCPREIQEMVQQSGVPALVWGGVHATTRQMPFVSTDQAKTGELMSRHAIGRGHTRLALLFPDLWNPGEEQMLAAIQKVLCEAGLGIDALVIRSIPPHAEMIDQALGDLFGKGDAPTALLCREFAVAERASLYLKENNRDVMVIYDGTIHSGSYRKGVPYVGTTHEPEYQAQLIGRMITRMILGQAIDQYQVSLPVQLVDEAEPPRRE